MREEYYYYWLGRIRGIGLRTIEEWIKEGYTPEQFYRGDSVFLRSIRGMTEKMKRTRIMTEQQTRTGITLIKTIRKTQNNR